MAEISINELHDKLRPIPAESREQGINYIEEEHRNYQEKYSDIAKGEDIDVKDLRQLFGALARKVGFEREW